MRKFSADLVEQLLIDACIMSSYPDDPNDHILHDSWRGRLRL